MDRTKYVRMGRHSFVDQRYRGRSAVAYGQPNRLPHRKNGKRHVTKVSNFKSRTREFFYNLTNTRPIAVARQNFNSTRSPHTHAKRCEPSRRPHFPASPT